MSEADPLIPVKNEYGSVHKNEEEGSGEQPWEEEHINLGDGGFRAAIFGFNDGLVTNLCLVAGLSVVSQDAPIIQTGVAGLLAGAVSMAIGEWLSMTAQAEGLEHELEVERRHLKQYPEEEEHHMREILEEHGISPNVVDTIMTDLSRAPVDQKLHLHARLELGIDPDDLGSPWKAAISSFLCFSIGAFIPIIPWLFITGNLAIFLTIFLSISASGATGYFLSSYSPRSATFNASRQVLICAAAVLFCVLINSLFTV